MKGKDHLVNRRRSYPEVTLEIGLRGWPAMDDSLCHPMPKYQLIPLSDGVSNPSSCTLKFERHKLSYGSVGQPH